MVTKATADAVAKVAADAIKKMKTAVVILNWNTKGFLEEFLPALVSSVEKVDGAEVVVADNASTDGSMEMMAEKFPQIRTLIFEKNLGFTGGYNRAFREVESEYFLLITFATALILCGVLVIAKGERPGKWEILFGLLIGIPNYFSARFLLRSLEYVSAVIAYPTFSVAGILAATAAGVFLFKERLVKRQWIAVGIILAALVLLNI